MAVQGEPTYYQPPQGYTPAGLGPGSAVNPGNPAPFSPNEEIPNPGVPQIPGLDYGYIPQPPDPGMPPTPGSGGYPYPPIPVPPDPGSGGGSPYPPTPDPGSGGVYPPTPGGEGEGPTEPAPDQINPDEKYRVSAQVFKGFCEEIITKIHALRILGESLARIPQGMRIAVTTETVGVEWTIAKHKTAWSSVESDILELIHYFRVSITRRGKGTNIAPSFLLREYLCHRPSR